MQPPFLAQIKAKMGKKEIPLECERWRGRGGPRRARGAAAGGCPSAHLQLSHTQRRGPGREAHGAAAAPGEPGRPHSSGLAQPCCPPPRDPRLPPRRPVSVPPRGPRDCGGSPLGRLPVCRGPHRCPSPGTPLGTAAVPLCVLQVPRGPRISGGPQLSPLCMLPVPSEPWTHPSPGSKISGGPQPSPHACRLSPRSRPSPGSQISRGPLPVVPCPVHAACPPGDPITVPSQVPVSPGDTLGHPLPGDPVYFLPWDHPPSPRGPHICASPPG